MQADFLFNTLKFAFASTLFFCLLLLCEFEWGSALIGGLSFSIILALIDYLRHKHPKHNDPRIASLEIGATISCLIGYWLILYSFAALENGGYSPGVLALGIIALATPIVGFLTFPKWGAQPKQQQQQQWIRGDSRFQVKPVVQAGKGSVDVESGGVVQGKRGGGRNFTQQPKPQIVSVVWYWNWSNLLLMIFGALPALLLGIVGGFLYGLWGAIQGLALGSVYTSLIMLYVVWNR